MKSASYSKAKVRNKCRALFGVISLISSANSSTEWKWKISTNILTSCFLNSNYRPTPETYQGPVVFGKLLSNGYQSDWYENRDTHFGKHKVSSTDAQFEAATRGDRQSTEYRDQINKNMKQQTGGGAYAQNVREVRGTKKSEQMKAQHTKQEEEGDLFKLSK